MTPATVTALGDPNRTIVVGSHGRSLVSRALIGDTAYTVVRRASVPYLWYR